MRPGQYLMTKGQREKARKAWQEHLLSMPAIAGGVEAALNVASA